MLDIDECGTTSHGCSHDCLNAPIGSYTCTCPSGYEIDADDRNCKGKGDSTTGTCTIPQRIFAVAVAF